MDKFRFPQLDANMEEATITRWYKREGEEVTYDEPLLEIATDKGVIEINSSADGVVRRIVAPENSTLPVGYIIALIGGLEEELPDDVDQENAELLQRYQEPAEQTETPRRRVKKKKRERVRASPSARKLAREYDVALSDVKAHFQVEVVNKSHVEQYVEEKQT